MRKMIVATIACLAMTLSAFVVHPARAQQSEKRIALVVGNGAYQNGALATAANDAGLIAQTLQAAGFDVTGARDLDAATMRASFREFVEKASASGPDTVALVYFAGRGVQFEGENYLVPVDARIARDSDVPLEAVRASDFVKPLASMPLKARLIIVDAGRPNNFGTPDRPLAGGLALMQPDDGMLIAFNAAPGTIAPEPKGNYGPFATALSEMIKIGGLSLNDLFERVRLRVNETTRGAELPWQMSRVSAPFVFFERTASAPPTPDTRFADLRDKPLRDLGANDAYLAALTRDTLRGYADFLAIYPDDLLAKRVRAIVAARREATTWRETVVANTPDAYWSYLRRYPRGPHAFDARRRLANFAAPPEPPESFSALAYDVSPPPPDEVVFVERPYVAFADPVYLLPPPPPIPVVFLPPPPAYFLDLPPPPPVVGLYVLPAPVYYPVPLWVERPAFVVAPPFSVVATNIHNTVIINPVNNSVVVTTPAGQQVAPAVLSQRANLPVGVGLAAAGLALPAAAAARASLARPAALTPGDGPQTGRPNALPAGNALPQTGAPASNARGLPQRNAVPGVAQPAARGAPTMPAARAPQALQRQQQQSVQRQQQQAAQRQAAIARQQQLNAAGTQQRGQVNAARQQQQQAAQRQAAIARQQQTNAARAQQMNAQRAQMNARRAQLNAARAVPRVPQMAPRPAAARRPAGPPPKRQ